MLKWAVDSLPLSENLCESWDYSALQLNSISSVSAFRAKQLGLLDVRHEGVVWMLEPKKDFVWSDGKQVSGLDLLHGFKRLFRSNARVMSELFSSVEKIEADKDCMRMFLKHIDPCFGELLELPNLAPYREGNPSCGPGVMQSKANGVWSFVSNPFWKGQSCSIQVLHIQDPDLNLTLFNSGELDCTADTAFPFARASKFEKELHWTDTGLEFTIVSAPGMSFGDEVSSIISTVRSRIETEVLSGIGSCESNSLSSSGKPALRLVYDPFYPNRQICEKLAAALSTVGFAVTCVEDDYYRPLAPYDLRLLITRGPHSKPSVRKRLASLHHNRTPLFKCPSVRLDRFPEMNLFTKLLEVAV
jgi:hypothetical protein